MSQPTEQDFAVINVLNKVKCMPLLVEGDESTDTEYTILDLQGGDVGGIQREECGEWTAYLCGSDNGDFWIQHADVSKRDPADAARDFVAMYIKTPVAG